MKIIAVPVNDLVAGDDGSSWYSTGDDPQFVLRPVLKGDSFSDGWQRIDIEIEFKENRRRPRLYWDDGEGFSEQRCNVLPLPRNGRISVVLPFVRKPHALRLDPMDCNGCFSLGELSISPIARLQALAFLIRPYIGKSVRRPGMYIKILSEFYRLWRVAGLSGVKGAFQYFATSHSGTAVRSYIYGRIAECRRSKERATRAVRSRSPFRSQHKAREQQTIAIGLVEHVGDIIACEPVARHVRKANPNAEITWVVNASYRELIDSNPFIDRTLAVDCLTDWIKLRAHGIFDRYIDLHVNERICQECRIPLLKTDGDPSITGKNYFDHGGLLEAFSLGAGLPKLDDAPRVYIPESVEASVEAFNLPPNYIVLNCSSNESYKDWTISRWHALVEFMAKERGIPVVEIGLQSSLAMNAENFINLCGQTSLLQAAEIIRRARLFVGVDSGPGHLANAVGTPGVILLGQVGPFKKYNPYTGNWKAETNVSLVRNHDGPASEIPYERVRRIVEDKLRAPSKGTVFAVLEGGFKETSGKALRDAETEVNSRVEKELRDERARLIAFYLPQYHPTPENDKYWGKGFTEWRNVGKATPFFKGQYQPRLPGELGYYDLRVPEIMEQQAELARTHGIDGFCYYYYWFQGKRLLHIPIDNMLRSKKPDFPFCFCWANENWTRRWDGMEQEILVAQRHTHEDDIAFIRHLIPAFEDERYIRINGKPLLLVYRTELFPNPLRTSEIWREEVAKAGIGDIYLVRCEGFDPFTNPGDIGFDASYEVPTFILPDELLLDDVQGLEISKEFVGRIFDYRKIVEFYSNRPDVPYKRFKDVMLAWDNTARHGKKAVVFHGANAEQYAEWLRNSMEYSAKRFEGDERLVFINAWNEWAEGTYLEPDLKFGRGFLEATNAVVHEVGQGNLGSSVNVGIGARL